MRKICFSLNFDVTKVHHISLVEYNFIQDESDKRAVIFRYKSVFFKTQTQDFVVQYMKWKYPGETTQQGTDYLKNDKIRENVIRTVVVVRNITQPIDKLGRHFDARHIFSFWFKKQCPIT